MTTEDEVSYGGHRFSGAGRRLRAVLIALLCAGCSSARPFDPNIITLAVFSSPNSFDPRVGIDEVSQKVHQLVYDNLFNLDDALRIVPGLGTGWEQPDARTYDVRLRTGVRFHDGHELTSADVVYTFTSLIDPAFVSGRKGAYRLLKQVEALDRYTVRFTLEQPFGSFPVNMVLPIVPAGAGREIATNPVGTGPYRFAWYAVDDRVELTAFADYFGGPPRNTGITLRVIPDDIMRGLELRKGTVDLVINDLSPDIIAQLREEGRMQIVESPGTDYTYLGFNMRDPILADKRVRHAIGHAIDRQSIVSYLRRGLAVPAVGILPPPSWAFERDVFQFRHDPAHARALLDEAGYHDPDGDGPEPRLHLTLKVSTTEFYRLQAAVIQSDLAAIGIALDVRSHEFATLFADVQRGNFQLCTLQWVGVSDPDMLRRVFHSAQMPPVGFNRGFYRDPEVDRLIDRATMETDDALRRPLYAEAQRRIAEDAPYVSLWYKTNVAIAQPDLEGVRLSPAAEFSFLRNVWRRNTKDTKDTKARKSSSQD
jgi:peptide/nickel transport system substrate-binding protein